MIRTSISRRRSKPRRGRVVDKPFLRWIHTLPSIVPSHDVKCIASGFFGCYVTAHHVLHSDDPRLDRQKHDRRTVPLWMCRHLQGSGDSTVEHSREAFEQRFHLDLERIMARQVEQFEKQKARKVA